MHKERCRPYDLIPLSHDDMCGSTNGSFITPQQGTMAALLPYVNGFGVTKTAARQNLFDPRRLFPNSRQPELKSA